MPNENTFVERIKNTTLRHLPSAMFYRPNDAKTTGVPDLFIFAGGTCAVVEAKCPAGLPRNKAAPWLQHDFSPLQVAFLKRVAENRLCAIGAINVLSTGESWIIPAAKLTVRMSYEYVKQNGLSLFDGTVAGDNRLVDAILFRLGRTS